MNKKRDFQVEWAKVVNDPELKPYKDKYGTKHKVLWALHTLYYNIVRELAPDRGFSGDKSFAEAMRSLELDLKFNNSRTLNFLFKDTVDYTKFKENADEALRLYSSS